MAKENAVFIIKPVFVSLEAYLWISVFHKITDTPKTHWYLIIRVGNFSKKLGSVDMEEEMRVLSMIQNFMGFIQLSFTIPVMPLENINLPGRDDKNFD